MICESFRIFISEPQQGRILIRDQDYTLLWSSENGKQNQFLKNPNKGKHMTPCEIPSKCTFYILYSDITQNMEEYQCNNSANSNFTIRCRCELQHRRRGHQHR